ncbi:MAG: histidine phosphatase family protein [Pseudomonadales bacterium]
MSSNPVTTIDLLRHGQTQADDILRGRIDVPLSENGYQQMQDRVAPYINPEFPWQQIITSPLQRCAQFANNLAEQHRSPINVHEGFLEIDFGDWDGRSFDELKAEDAELFSKIWIEPHKYRPPNGETFQAFSSRINTAWQGILQQHCGKHILLICHGGVIRALLSNIMQTPLTSLSRIDVPYACLSRIRVHHHLGQSDWPQLIFHNPGNHYPGESQNDTYSEVP